MTIFTALYDANVLYPAPLRDLLVRLAGTGRFRARWTNAIHEEWIRNVLSDRPDLNRERLERTRDLMNNLIFDCLVIEYEALIPNLHLPDAEDRHVLAAAVVGGADFIVTFNLKDFPESVLSQYEIKALHPDFFVLKLLQLDESLVCDTIRKQRLDLKNPPKSADEMLTLFEDQGLANTVALLRAQISRL